MYLSKTKDSNGSLPTSESSLMKIPLFIKHIIGYAVFCVVLIVSLFGIPAQAHAGFFSKIFGSSAQADEQPEISNPSGLTHNSQTIPLLEPAITPDLKAPKDSPAVSAIVEDQALSADMGPVGMDNIDRQYASSAEIKTYTVKSGDSIEKVAKEFGISKNTIIQSNEFLNSKGTLKVGQVLTILPVDGLVYTVAKGDTILGIAKKYGSTSKEILSYNDISNASDIQIGDTIVIPGGEKPAPIVKEKVAEAPKNIPTPAPTTQNEVVPVQPEPIPVQTRNSTVSSSGFIWPLTLGAGRVSQGLHDDNAMDIAAPKGTPIYAPKAGTVLIADSAGYNGGYGLYVVINFTDGGQMLFGHMSKVIAVAGTHVNQGDLIGLVGTTGKSTGNHVHLSARGMKNPYGGLKKNNTSADFN